MTSSVENEKPTTIDELDADLREQLDAIASHSIREKSLRILLNLQHERNLKQSRLNGLSPVEKRFLQTSELLEQPIEASDVHHLHSFLALCGLPYKKPRLDPVTKKEPLSHHKKYGKMSIQVNAGSLIDPRNGDMVQQGLPYGPKARLLLVDICTRALRQNSPTVELENSLSCFIQTLGFDVVGGPMGTIKLFKEQINRLAACNIHFGFFNGQEATTFNSSLIEEVSLWFPDNPEQRMLWPSTIKLSHQFFSTLQQHAFPLDLRLLSCFTHSARQMDILLWLAYRTHNLHKPYFLRWEPLQQQFSQSKARRLIHFKQDFQNDLKAIQKVLGEDLPIRISTEGVKILPNRNKKLVSTRLLLKR